MSPVGYVYQAAIICPECAELLTFPYYDRDKGETIESTADMSAMFALEETDSPQACDRCGEFIESTLTDAGLEYVRGVLAEDSCPAEWRDRWGYLAKESGI